MNSIKAKRIISLLTEVQDGRKLYQNIDEILSILPMNYPDRHVIIQYKNKLKKSSNLIGKQLRPRKKDRKDFKINKLFLYLHEFIK